MRFPPLVRILLGFGFFVGSWNALAQDMDYGKRQKASVLFRTYRESGGDLAKQKEAVGDMLGLGSGVAAILDGEVEKELDELLKEYREAFATRVARMTKRSLPLPRRKEVASLQKQLRGLIARGEALQKSTLVTEGRAALARIETLLQMDRKRVLDGDLSLVDMRNRLIHLMVIRKDCARALDREVPLLDEKMLVYEEESLAGNAKSGFSPRRPRGNRKTAPIEEAELAAIRDLNRMRRLIGLETLEIDVRLCEAGREHSRDMKEKGFFSHTNPDPSRATFGQRARAAGTSASSENLADAPTAKKANALLFGSPDHFRNMFDPGWTRVGIGHVSGYWTQLFGR